MFSVVRPVLAKVIKTELEDKVTREFAKVSIVKFYWRFVHAVIKSTVISCVHKLR